MTITLRPYQQEAKQAVYDSWRSGARNTLAVLPTGAGKTVLFSDIIREHNGAACAVAHRQELVGQISMALARDGVRHRIIGPNSVIRLISYQHQTEFGRSFYDPNALAAVAGVDTLIRRGDVLSHWLPQVTLWVQDEAHHVLKTNKWGKAVEMFPNARGLGVTATPLRADGKGLGRHHDGVFDDMYVGPDMRELIGMGYLSDFRIFAPPSDLDLEGVNITASGDYSKKQLKQRVRRSRIVGDVVEHYQRIAPGRLGVTFVESVDTASEMANRFNQCGVPAEVITAKTPDKIRSNLLGRFRRREILQLVNVDLFGEGFDLPALEVVSMARPTQSYGLFAQQFGRALRIMDGKTEAIIIDHVGNTLRHGVPDRHKVWTLDRREKRGKNERNPDEIPLRNCTECLGVYEAYRISCPYCGAVPVPVARSGPEYVEGDLVELDPATLQAMYAERQRVDGAPRIPRDATPLVAAGIKKNHAARQNAQADLRDAMSWWSGVQVALGYSVRESQKLFYIRFGTDVLSAQALGRPDAEDLYRRVWDDITRLVERHELKGVTPVETREAV